MNVDHIRALVDRYGRSMDAAGYADETDMGERHRAEADRTYVEISADLTTLSDQLLAKSELANLYAASLRQSEKEVEALTQENQRIRLEFRADCEKHAEELFKVQRDAQRWRWMRAYFVADDEGWDDRIIAASDSEANLDAAIDAARSQSEEKPSDIVDYVEIKDAQGKAHRIPGY